MRAGLAAVASMLLVIGALALSGCDSSAPSATVQAGFAPGAFPPTLTGEDYHSKSWTRTDCLTCHELGVKDAPKMRHVSVPEIAAEAKCRTCHVLIADQMAPK
jgi:cytochrome c5